MPNQLFQNRIVGYDNVPPDSLNPNPLNYRTHPDNQVGALKASLNELGWLQTVIVNKTTNTVLDGHARIKLAVANREPTIPVTYVELPADLEAKFLLTFDPITGLATANKEILEQLLSSVTTGSADLQALYDSIAKANGLLAEQLATQESNDDTTESNYKEQYGVIVICENEDHQQEVYEQLQADGYEKLKVVTT